MREKSISALLLVIAVIHLVPVSGVLGPTQLESLYGIAIDTPDLEILMRHRAVLFGILGAVFILAAMKKNYQPLAFTIAGATLLPFFLLVLNSESYGDAINKIILGDIVALLALITAITLRYGTVVPYHGGKSTIPNSQ